MYFYVTTAFLQFYIYDKFVPGGSPQELIKKCIFKKILIYR